MNKRVGLMAASVLLAGGLAACGSQGSTTNARHQAATVNGGTLVVTWSGNPQTIDPRKIYDAEDWNIGRALYIGLYTMNSRFQLKPGVAEGNPIVSDHGLVYTIHLNPKATWSNGQPLTAQDFVYALRTELSPKFQSPDTYLWWMVKGANAYEAGKSSYLGIKALNDHTLQYTLSTPYSAFQYVLSVPASFPVDPAAINRVATNPVTDGPYIVSQWKTGVSMLLRKNPHYFRRHAYPAHVLFDFNVDPSVGILRVEDGQADIVGDGIPSANYLQLEANPQYRSDITRGYLPAVILLALNEKIKPFNNPLVREAVQMAINKRHLVQLLNGRAQPANGVLPPSLPGFGGRDIPNLYPYNPAKAKSLLKKAGYPHGFSTTLGLASEMTGSAQIETEVEADLGRIGIHITAKPLPTETAALAKVPMMTYSWYMDYPDPADFISGFITSPAVAGGSNPAFLSDPVLDAWEQKAASMPQGPARVALYRKIDERAMKDAAYVPLFYPESTFFHSPRVHGFVRPAVYFPAIYSHLRLSQ
ncbi:MAG: ABC transporter substrate-binding protein [Firmicutes bacterium]|nr:ABC transporter substrate-binding protein [Bacillota bacterium]